jgi:hypothetical protein
MSGGYFTLPGYSKTPQRARRPGGGYFAFHLWHRGSLRLGKLSGAPPRPLLFQGDHFERPDLIGLLAQRAAIQDLACHDSLLS